MDLSVCPSVPFKRMAGEKKKRNKNSKKFFIKNKKVTKTSQKVKEITKTSQKVTKSRKSHGKVEKSPVEKWNRIME